jgi:hypothetical protein
MRGGIPFTLNVPQEHETGNEVLDDEAVIDALRRYKVVNNNADLDITPAEPFLQAIRVLGSQVRLTFYEDAVKVRLPRGEHDFVIDYNFEEPDSVFVLSRKNGKLFVQDCSLADIAKTLEHF